MGKKKEHKTFYLSKSLNLPSTIAGTFFKGLISENKEKKSNWKKALIE